MNSFEIEMKLPVFSLEEIKEKLIWKGFQEEATVRESDMYYNSEHHDVKKLGEALRIRKSTDLFNGQTQAQLNFKGKKMDQVDGLGSFLELEVIASEESMRETYLREMERLLTELGLSMADTVRTSYLGMLYAKKQNEE